MASLPGTMWNYSKRYCKFFIESCTKAFERGYYPIILTLKKEGFSLEEINSLDKITKLRFYIFIRLREKKGIEWLENKNKEMEKNESFCFIPEEKIKYIKKNTKMEVEDHLRRKGTLGSKDGYPI